MKAVTGFLFVLLLDSTLTAQQPDFLLDNQKLLASPSVVGAAFHAPTDVAEAIDPDQAPPPARKEEPKKNASVKPLKRSRIDTSMVGYLDSAAVQTEVRVRFDAGFNDPRPDLAEYFYAGTAGPNSGAIQRTLNFQQLYLMAEYAPQKRISGFVQVPFRWIQVFFVPETILPNTTPTPPNGGGISDLQAGLRFAAIRSASRIVTFQFGADFPTGDGTNGLGTGHYSIEPKVQFFQKLSERTAIEAEAGDSHPIGGTIYVAPPSPAQNFAGDVAMFGVGPSYQLIQRDSYRITPVLELVSWHVFGGLQTGASGVVQSAAGTNVFNAKLGARLSLADGTSIYAGYGRGLTSDIWYRNLFRVEYRHTF